MTPILVDFRVALFTKGRLLETPVIESTFLALDMGARTGRARPYPYEMAIPFDGARIQLPGRSPAWQMALGRQRFPWLNAMRDYVVTLRGAQMTHSPIEIFIGRSPTFGWNRHVARAMVIKPRCRLLDVEIGWMASAALERAMARNALPFSTLALLSRISPKAYRTLHGISLGEP